MAYKNAFDAVGMDRDDATVAALRADFAAILRDWIKERQLTQAAAGNQLKVPQAVVSKIVNGNVTTMSVEYLIKLLVRADIAWTARSWHAPSDAAVCKGPAPDSWVGAGNPSDVFKRLSIIGVTASTYQSTGLKAESRSRGGSVSGPVKVGDA